MGDIERRLSQLDFVYVVKSAPTNGYQADILAIIDAFPRQRVALIGHSFAAIPMIEAIKARPGRVVYLAEIEPVSCRPFVNSYAVPDGPKLFWAQRSRFDLERPLELTNAGAPVIVPGGHNDVPHSSVVLDRVEGELEELHGAGA